MGKIVLVTGGARSGKSSFAEEFVKNSGSNILYIATAVPFDDEMKDRIRIHQQSRINTWTTYEGFENLDKIIESRGENYDGILLDCITVMMTNIIFNYPGFDEENLDSLTLYKIEGYIVNEINRMVSCAKSKDLTMIMVTNEVGSGLVPESKLGRVFRDMAGRINQIIAKQAEEVYLLVSGIPMKIK